MVSGGRICRKCTSYEEAIKFRIDKLEDDGDKKQAEILRQRLFSAILGAFGIEVPKRKETLLQRLGATILGASKRWERAFVPNYVFRNWIIRSCVLEWMKMQP